MLVVALSVAGVNGYASALASCPMHEHGGAVHAHDANANDGASTHADHASQDVASTDCADAGADTAGHSGDEPASGDGPCKHAHLHSCATFAVAAGDCGLSISAHARITVPVGEAHIPLGQLSSPLFRPPRDLA
ncbi:hypothetical protein [Hyphomicrobium sp.]|uniref:hypothetical protein n=1 Tax=Hyphomicrobium sp. TaxID=82 RepID=UPI0025B8E0BB|nr:hypothetical protein [Hyphomicrobium sp.]